VDPRRAPLVLFAIGATAGSALDGIHTWSGTTEYPSPIFLRMAWWTPFLFGLAGLSTGLAYPLVEKLSRRRVATAREPRDVAIAFSIFVALYFASGFLPVSNPVKLAVLVIGAAFLWARYARTRAAAMLAIGAAVIGPVVEIVLTSFGAFRHLQPDALGIPIWLPALYAAGSIGFGVVGLRISLPSSGARSLL
jgi:hypothetical protein